MAKTTARYMGATPAAAGLGGSAVQTVQKLPFAKAGGQYRSGVYAYNGRYYYYNAAPAAAAKTATGTARRSSAGSSAAAKAAAQAAALAAQRAAAQQLYGKNLEALRSAYQSQLQSAQQGLTGQLAALGQDYRFGQKQLDTKRGDDARSTYVNMMQQQRMLPGQLAAAGITGGPSESVMAAASNRYQSSQAALGSAYASALAQLLNTLQTSQANARRQYQNSLATSSLRQANSEAKLKQTLLNTLSKLNSR